MYWKEYHNYLKNSTCLFICGMIEILFIVWNIFLMKKLNPVCCITNSYIKSLKTISYLPSLLVIYMKINEFLLYFKISK